MFMKIVCCVITVLWVNVSFGDVIFLDGFENDLPFIPTTTDDPSDRHIPQPLGSTAANQGYYEYLPPGYELGNQEYPLLLFIHGLGENGDGDSQLDRMLSNGPPKLIDNNTWNQALPFVILSPQRSGGGCTSSNQIKDFIDYALLTYDINPTRVYLTGLSCGAIGSWNYLGNHTNTQIAGVVPIAGDGNGAFNNAGCALGLVPIWAFHGDADGVVGVSGTNTPIDNINACQNPAPVEAIKTIYPGVGHNSWAMTYDLSAGHDIYTWLLSYRNFKAEANP